MKITAKLAGAVHRHTRSPIRRLWLVAAGVWLVGASLLFTMLGAGLLAAPSTHATGGQFIMCPSGRSGIATSVTSCPFADNVRSSYIASGGASLINVYSPVTGEVYTMQCGTGFTASFVNGATVNAVRCVGGNDAVVVIW